ncbi:hypothetical protein RW095_28375 [Paraburkholderia kirstenboschensis]|jgi:enamine deaminase RidA (YjgF/YER057c/UK114 family)|uniref:Uncharacterized protein n=1 Tax=Paraburkholderia kirstenboschensis TaxID=1245436 RepID=A0ABZ0ESG7_9BURK|nr:hypothetical protein [Paraburkholderia kirstenboschensis]WOD20116.1 hypothetical protein RW095_28375 [Paraburkholderia kirstenboschensis]
MKERKAVVPAGMEAVYERIRYAPAVKVGSTIYVSGQIGRDDKMKLGGTAGYIVEIKAVAVLPD